MNSWIPVIGTLSGAVVAGGISVVVHWMSNRHATENTKLILAEERAKWASEKRLERLQTFYAEIEKLLDATSQFRVQQAWQASAAEEPGLAPPEWVPSYDTARGGWEDQMSVVARELLFQDEAVQAQYEQSNISWIRWMRAKTTDDGVQALLGMESDIRGFNHWIAKRYRTQFEDRYKGVDHVG